MRAEKEKSSSDEVELMIDFARSYHKRLFQRVFDRTYFDENPYYNMGSSWESLLNEPYCTLRYASTLRILEIVKAMIWLKGWKAAVPRSAIIEALDKKGLYHDLSSGRKRLDDESEGTRLFSATNSFPRTIDRMCEAGLLIPKKKPSTNTDDQELEAFYRLDPGIANDPRSPYNDLPEKKRRLALRYQQLYLYRELAQEAYKCLGRDPAEVDVDMGRRLRERDPWVTIPSNMFKNIPIPPVGKVPSLVYPFLEG